VKQQLAAVRTLFDWLIIGQVAPSNPASAVRGPTHVVKTGTTPVLSPEEARRVLDAIDVSTHAGLRDRALIALMVFSFARIGAALSMKVADVYVQDSLCASRRFPRGPAMAGVIRCASYQPFGWRGRSEDSPPSCAAHPDPLQRERLLDSAATYIQHMQKGTVSINRPWGVVVSAH
jgi:integrase